MAIDQDEFVSLLTAEFENGEVLIELEGSTQRAKLVETVKMSNMYRAEYTLEDDTFLVNFTSFMSVYGDTGAQWTAHDYGLDRPFIITLSSLMPATPVDPVDA